MSKTRANTKPPRRFTPARWLSLAVTGSVFCMGMLQDASAQSFPQVPLMDRLSIGASPNIVLLMDTSSSMSKEFMPDTYDMIPARYYRANDGLYPMEQNFRRFNLQFNNIAYDPSTTYKTWIKADGSYLPNIYFLRDPVLVTYTTSTGVGNTDGNWSQDPPRNQDGVCNEDIGTCTIYYVRKPTATGDVRDPRDYYMYRVDSNTVLTRCESRINERGTANDRNYTFDRGCVTINAGSNLDKLPNTTRTFAQELDNYRAWFSYHRTRAKVAKAGVLKAFSDADGTQFRLGTQSMVNSGTDPLGFPIPVNSDNGLLINGNRTRWFDYIITLSGGGAGKPLPVTLGSIGNYFKRTDADGPYGGTRDASGNQFTCRANYALVTTDGYWTSGTYYPAAPTYDVDGDGQDGTLADVAIHYWQTDLRPDLSNNVPTNGNDSASYQHMSTFAISIGNRGSLTRNGVLLDPDRDAPPAPNSTEWPLRLPAQASSEAPEKIDDLWHAAVNGRGRFTVAKNAESFAKAIRKMLDAIAARHGAGSNLASNSTDLDEATWKVQASYYTEDWTGEVSQYAYTGTGLATTPTWKLSTVLNASTTYKDRTILTWSGSAGALLSEAIWTAKTGQTSSSNPTAANVLAYVRGDTSMEIRDTNAVAQRIFRKRRSPMGDIVNSSPFYSSDVNTIFLGANDGMMHAIDAANGTVKFSYMPKGIDYAALAGIGSPDYTHRFFVDGSGNVSPRSLNVVQTGTDAATGAAIYSTGSNVLVMPLGRGGKGVFALDVTNPASMDTAKVLWDDTFQTGGDADMGYVLSQPLIAKGNNGKILAVVPNGVDSANGKAVIFIYQGTVDSSTGAITWSTATKFNAGQGTGNGMTAVGAADTDGNGTMDTIYGGDLKGNVWRLDVSNASESNWAYLGGATPTPLFTAKDSAGNTQPITGGFAFGKKNGKIYVGFGTGKFITPTDMPTAADLASTATGTSTPQSVRTQSVYGLIDTGVAIGTRGTDLVQRTYAATGTDSLGRPARALEAYTGAGDEIPSTKKGWYIDLGVPTTPAPGNKSERVVTAPVVSGSAMYLSSSIPLPSTGCSPGGRGYLNAFNLFTGRNPENGYFNIAGTGNSVDRLTGNYTGQNGVVSSIDLGVGLPSRVSVNSKSVDVAGSTGGVFGNVGTRATSTGATRMMWREVISNQ